MIVQFEPIYVDDNEIESEIIAEDVDDDTEEEFNFHAMRQDDITVSPITEVTEPSSDYQDYQSDAMSITPTNMMDTEPGDDYPENSPTPPPLDQQQKNMPCESTILFEQAENQVHEEIEKEEIDEFEAAERQILEEQMEVDEEPIPTPKGAYNMDFDNFDDPNFNPFETKTKVVETFDEPGDETPPPKGAYNVDFDQFDDPNFNPFETQTKVQNNFDTDKSTVGQAVIPQEELVNLSEEPSSNTPEEENVVNVISATEPSTEPGDELNALTPPSESPPPRSASPTGKPPKASLDDSEAPPPPKGAYNVDYDKFDDPNFNPFETKTKVVDTFDEPEPIEVSKGAYNVDFEKFDDPNFNPFETKTKVVDLFETDAPAEPVTEKSAPADADEPGDDMNEINSTFEAPKRKPPTLGKNRKPIKKKLPPTTKQPRPQSPPKEAVDNEVEAPPTSKGAYDVDFDKFDDPNFNPFETKTKVVDKFDEVPDDMEPLPAKGAYAVDFDKFDDPNFNPFETKTKVIDNFNPPGKFP